MAPPITMLAYPAFLVIMAMGAKGGGGVAKLAEAKAFSPETARRPESVNIKGGAATLARPIRKGLVIASGDGRFYVNRPMFVKRQKTMLTIFLIVAALGGVITLLIWAPWKH